MKNFELHRPEDISGLLALINESTGYEILAGGTDLLVRWKRGLKFSEKVIDLNRLKELEFIKKEKDGVEIGALVKINDLITNEELAKSFPALIEAAKVHSSPQIRNLATVAGNICNASPAADLIPPLLVYGAELKIVGGEGEFRVKLKDFITGPGTTILKKGELVYSIFLPLPADNFKTSFEKMGKRKSHEIAIANCAVGFILDGDQIKSLKIAMGAVGPTPILLENLTWFKQFNEENINKLNQVIDESISPISDQRSLDWYRRDVIKVMIRRILSETARGEGTS